MSDLSLQVLLEEGCQRSGDFSIRSSQLKVGPAKSFQKCVLRRLGWAPTQGFRVKNLGLKGLGSQERSGRTLQWVKAQSGDPGTEKVGVLGAGVPGLGVPELGSPGLEGKRERDCPRFEGDGGPQYRISVAPAGSRVRNGGSSSSSNDGRDISGDRVDPGVLQLCFLSAETPPCSLPTPPRHGVS